jgi:predicted acyl esterase
MTGAFSPTAVTSHARMKLFPVAFGLGLALVFVSASASVPKKPHSVKATKTVTYRIYEVMIPMRDGVRLQTEIAQPIAQSKPLPILLDRTPYGIDDISKVKTFTVTPGGGRGELSALSTDGYIFALQNIRGRFKSGGTFVLNRPPCAPAPCVDETTDAYDTVDWLV